MRITAPKESVTLKDDNRINVQIKAKSIFQPRKNLGHYKATSGNRSIQAEKIEEKAIKLVNHIFKCNCTRTENRML